MTIPGSVIVVIRLLIKQLPRTSMIGMENNIVQKASRKCLSQSKENIREKTTLFSENITQIRLFRKIMMHIWGNQETVLDVIILKQANKK